ncbi:FecR family protein [Sphingomonas sp. DT-51]|uniref:FecR family protein n=1 Tax=Sphingomonas sp. DT-51 TaxID=3396165 RepID=UPI003F1E1F3E
MSSPELRWDDIVGLPPHQAAALLVDRLDVDPSAAHEALADRWIAHDDENRRAWMRARDAWDALEDWRSSPDLVRQRQQALSRSFHARQAGWWTPARAATAAAGIAACGLLALTLVGERPSREGDGIARFGHPDVVAGADVRYVRLPDGTGAVLSPGSALDLAFGDDARLARLERGRVVLDVARDARRPFRLAVGARVISDVGTVFSAERTPDGMRVRLMEGSVTIERGDFRTTAAESAVTLVPGQTFVSGTKGERVSSPATRGGEPAPGRRIAFRDEPLDSAARRISEGSLIILSIDPRVAAIRVTGSFRTGDAAQFARTLVQLHPIRLETRPDGSLILVPRSGR